MAGALKGLNLRSSVTAEDYNEISESVSTVITTSTTSDGSGSPSPHALSSSHHTGQIGNNQAEQFAFAEAYGTDRPAYNSNRMTGALAHVLPAATDTYDLGDYNKWWRQAFISQINAVVFAENVQQLLGGWFTVGHAQGVLETPSAYLQCETATVVGTITAGVLQKETATVTGTASAAGTITVVVTAAGMTGGTATVTATFVNLATASELAASIRAALSFNAAVAAYFTIGGTGADVVLTRKAAAADDGTLNIALSGASAQGFADHASSSPTTAGVVSGAGTVSVTVTANGMTGSGAAMTTNLDATAGMTATQVATMLASELTTHYAALAAFFTITSSGADLIFTATAYTAANDGTMNVAITNGTCTGLTAAPTSANTVVGGDRTDIDFGVSLSVNDFILIKSHDVYGVIKTEYMQVTAAVSGTTYTVTRDKATANSPDPVWAEGTVWLNLGYTGDGRIEFNASGTPRIGLFTQGSTYNAQTEVVRVGDLNANWGYVAETYGVAIGQYESGYANITLDATKGLRMRTFATNNLVLEPDGDVFMGSNINDAGPGLSPATVNLAIFTATTQTYNSETMLTGDLLLGDNTVTRGNLKWDKAAGDILLRSGVTTKIKLQTDGDLFIGSDVSAAATTQFAIFTTPQTYNSETTIVAGDVLLGVNSTSKANLYWSYADSSLYLRSGTTKTMALQSDGDVFIGSNISAAATTQFSIFTTAQTYNSEVVETGDLMIGDNSIVELILNGGFETAGAGSPDIFASWTEHIGHGLDGFGAGLIAMAGPSHSGTYSANLVSGTGLDTWISQDFTVVPGGVYTLSFWTRSLTNYAGRYLVVDATHGADIVSLRSTGVPGTTFTLVTYTMTIPAACVTVIVYFYGPDTSAKGALFDDVSFTTGLANVFWDKSAGVLRFRGGIVSQCEISTGGQLVAGGGKFIVDATGPSMLVQQFDPSESRDEATALTWKDAYGVVRAHITSFVHNTDPDSELELFCQGWDTLGYGIINLIVRDTDGATTHTLRLTSGGVMNWSGTIIGTLVSGGNVTMPDDSWIGLSGAKGRITFDDTPATDTVTFNDCNIVIAGTVDGYDVSALGAASHAAATVGAGGLSDHLLFTGQELTLSAPAHSEMAGIGANDHHNQSHVLATQAALGGDHTISGATAGHVLRASGATTALFSQLQYGDLGGAGSTLDLVGWTAADTIGKLTPSADVTGGTSAILKSAAGDLKLASATITGAFTLSGTVSSNLIPTTTDTYDIGSYTKLWRKGYLSELDTLLFAEQTIQLLGGWEIVAHDAGSVEADVTAIAATIDFGKAMTPGDWVVFRSGVPAVEYMLVGAVVGGTVYNVTRDLDGSGANAWAKGSAFLVLGTTGDGRIELNAYDTPRIQLLTQGAAWNTATEVTRLGDLNGWGDYVAENYGLAVGEYAADHANITIDPTNGIRIRNHSTTVIALSGTEARFDNLIKIYGASGAISLGVVDADPHLALPTSAAAGTGIWLDRTGMYGLLADVQQATFSATTGAITAGAGGVTLDNLGLLLTTSAGASTARINWGSRADWTRQASIYAVDANPNMQLVMCARQDGADPNWSGAYLIVNGSGSLVYNWLDGHTYVGGQFTVTKDGNTTILGGLNVNTTGAGTGEGRFCGDVQLGVGGDLAETYGRSLYFAVDASPVNVAAIRMIEHTADHYGLELHTYDGGLAARVILTGAGNVGIAAAPDSTVRFQVLGVDTTSSNYACAFRKSDSTNLMYCRNDAYPYVLNAWNVGSDAKLKKNIKDIPSALDIVKQWRPRAYDMVGGRTNRVGFIAQEMRLVSPDLVSEAGTDKDSLLAIAYTEMTPYLVRGMQELDHWKLNWQHRRRRHGRAQTQRGEVDRTGSGAGGSSGRG
jgi:hypothetical protein